jgi:hypothetical protein
MVLKIYPKMDPNGMALPFGYKWFTRKVPISGVLKIGGQTLRGK